MTVTPAAGSVFMLKEKLNEPIMISTINRMPTMLCSRFLKRNPAVAAVMSVLSAVATTTGSRGVQAAAARMTKRLRKENPSKIKKMTATGTITPAQKSRLIRYEHSMRLATTVRLDTGSDISIS